LRHLGAEPAGIALPPETDRSLSTLAGIWRSSRSHHVDVRDGAAVTAIVTHVDPEIVFHLAAQSVVRRSHERPVDTFATNVMGVVHVLEAVRAAPSVRSVVMITSDKVYQDRNWVWAYRESDTLGGHDPYSSSKACGELAVESWRSSFFRGTPVGIATVRAGNVIGGGDWAPDRLVPDLVRAFDERRPAEIRSPDAVRPWIHVLAPLTGYVLLAEQLWERPAEFSEAWNFGPHEGELQTVASVACRAAELWGDGAEWRSAPGPHPHETAVLRIDATKSRERLRWRPRLDLKQALAWTIGWYRRWRSGDDPALLCSEQIERYLAYQGE
jgi:CDP-glucose 4,6-dehydratase